MHHLYRQHAKTTVHAATSVHAGTIVPAVATMHAETILKQAMCNAVALPERLSYLSAVVYTKCRSTFRDQGLVLGGSQHEALYAFPLCAYAQHVQITLGPIVVTIQIPLLLLFMFRTASLRHDHTAEKMM